MPVVRSSARSRCQVPGCAAAASNGPRPGRRSAAGGGARCTREAAGSDARPAGANEASVTRDRDHAAICPESDKGGDSEPVCGRSVWLISQRLGDAREYGRLLAAHSGSGTCRVPRWPAGGGSCQRHDLRPEWHSKITWLPCGGPDLACESEHSRHQDQHRTTDRHRAQTVQVTRRTSWEARRVVTVPRPANVFDLSRRGRSGHRSAAASRCQSIDVVPSHQSELAHCPWHCCSHSDPQFPIVSGHTSIGGGPNISRYSARNRW